MRIEQNKYFLNKYLEHNYFIDPVNMFLREPLVEFNNN